MFLNRTFSDLFVPSLNVAVVVMGAVSRVVPL